MVRGLKSYSYTKHTYKKKISNTGKKKNDYQIIATSILNQNIDGC